MTARKTRSQLKRKNETNAQYLLRQETKTGLNAQYLLRQETKTGLNAQYLVMGLVHQNQKIGKESHQVVMLVHQNQKISPRDRW
jgi:hypothetical protein